MRNWFVQPMFDTAGAAGGAAGGAAAATTPWYDGKVTDPELVGYFASRGWDKDPTVAAIEAGKAHRAAEKFIGIPAGELIRLPKNMADSEAMRPIYERLGVPKDPKDYDFSAVKDADERTLSIARETAAKLLISKDQAPQLAQVLAKIQKDAADATLADRTAKLAEEKAALDKSWGPNKEANMIVARATALKLGVTPEQVSALEGVVGYKAVMDMFLSVGGKIGEDTFVRNEKGAGGVMTREMAAEKVAELKSDPAWTKRYLAGDKAAAKELQQLISIQHG